MAYRYDEKSGEFIDSPESKNPSHTQPNGHTPYHTNPTHTNKNSTGGCLTVVGVVLFYVALILAYTAFCSLFN